jgi:putative SOS response-associated peptidase YedK
MFNARIETIFEKKSFSGLIRRNRCVIIGSSYFEWQKIENSKKKIKFQFTPENLNLFYFAGLYNNWVDRTTGEVIPSVTMITKPAIEQITHIHDRMPAILSQNQLKNWLSSDIKSAKDIDFLNNQEIGINFQEVA